MTKKVSIKRNFIMNAILTMSTFIFPLITFPYVSRVLLAEGTGRVTFATSLISYFTMLAHLGIPTYGIRTCAKIRENKEELTRTAHELLIINLIMSVVAYGLLAGALTFVPSLQEDKPLYVLISITILLSSIGMEWLYKALEQYTYITVRSVIFKGIAVVAMFLLVQTESDYVIYGGITIFAASASNIFNLIHAHRYIGFKPVGNYNLRRHLKPVMVFFAMACATTIYTHLDAVMLGFMTTKADVGYYNAAVKIKTILVSIVTSLGAVLLPRASFYVEHGNMEEFRRITSKALNFVMLIATPLFVYFIFFAKEGILLLSGNMFLESVVPMQVIMPTLLLIGITNVLGIQILVPTGRETVVLYSEVAGATVDIIINSLLIPRMQATGAAIGTLIAEFVVLLVQYFALRKEVKEGFKEIHYINICIGVLLGIIASFWVKYINLGEFISLLISSFLFFGSYGCFLLIKKEKIVMDIIETIMIRIRKLWKKRDGKSENV